MPPLTLGKPASPRLAEAASSGELPTIAVIIPTFNHMGTVAYAAAAAVDNQLSFVSSSILYRSWVALEGTSNPSLKRDGEGVRSGAAVQ